MLDGEKGYGKNKQGRGKERRQYITWWQSFIPVWNSYLTSVSNQRMLTAAGWAGAHGTFTCLPDLNLLPAADTELGFACVPALFWSILFCWAPRGSAPRQLLCLLCLLVSSLWSCPLSLAQNGAGFVFRFSASTVTSQLTFFATFLRLGNMVKTMRPWASESDSLNLGFSSVRWTWL